MRCGSHQRKPPIPVDTPGDNGPWRRHRPFYSMYDISGQPTDFCYKPFFIFNDQRTGVIGLAAPSYVESGAVQDDSIIGHTSNLGIELP